MSSKVASIQAARREASRCLGCLDAPCQEHCPVRIPIPKVHRAIATGNLRHAAELVRAANPMAHTCGACCPQETFCQSACLRASLDYPLDIRGCHQTATDWEWENHPCKPELYKDLMNKTQTYKGFRIAIIGGGPAGIACAVGLGRLGFPVDIYEMASEAGGIPRWAIPDGRVPAGIPKRDVDALAGYSISIYTSKEIVALQDVREQYDACLIATGTPSDGRMDITGQDGPGVYGGLEFLRKAKTSPDQVGIREPVRIIGGGNVAVDCALVANSLGASRISVIYRRHRAELPAWERELGTAFHKGVEFLFLLMPVAIEREGDRISRLICRRMTLGLPGEDGRREPIPLPGDTISLETGTVVIATGQTAQPFDNDVLHRDEKGNILVNETKCTNLAKVYAAGDVAGAGGTVVEAARSGLIIAGRMAKDLMGNGNNPFCD
jgi:glutamate synthase (NADPH/NADH) small chain